MKKIQDKDPWQNSLRLKSVGMNHFQVRGNFAEREIASKFSGTIYFYRPSRNMEII